MNATQREWFLAGVLTFFVFMTVVYVMAEYSQDSEVASEIRAFSDRIAGWITAPARIESVTELTTINNSCSNFYDQRPIIQQPVVSMPMQSVGKDLCRNVYAQNLGCYKLCGVPYCGGHNVTEAEYLNQTK